jgi:prepilin-type N-terminal cleavage/methylation domain-containing protein
MNLKKIVRLTKNNKGLTLLEVMVSLIIFSVGFLCLLPMIVTAIKGNEFADASTKASNYTQAKIEELKATHSFIGDIATHTDTVENMIRNWNVTNPATHYYQIMVKVSWNDHYGKAHQCSTLTGESTTE